MRGIEYYCSDCGNPFTESSPCDTGSGFFCPSCRDGHAESSGKAYSEVYDALIKAGYSDIDAQRRAVIDSSGVVKNRARREFPREVARCMDCKTLLETGHLCSRCRRKREIAERDEELREEERVKRLEQDISDIIRRNST